MDIIKSFEASAVNVVNYLSGLGYFGVGAGMAIESASIPLPSEIILPFAGYMVWQGQLDLYWATLAATVGGTIGSIIAYYIGLWGGRPLIIKYGRFLYLDRKLYLADEWFQKYGDAAVFFSRLLPIIRTFISLPAGIARMNIKRFIIYTFIGSLPWCYALIWVGYKLGENWSAIRAMFHKVDVILVAGAAILLLLWYIRRRKKTKTI